jgi:hypothetical protein
MPISVLERNHLGDQIQALLDQLKYLTQRIDQMKSDQEYIVNRKIVNVENVLLQLQYQLTPR